MSKRHLKPLLIFDLAKENNFEKVSVWIKENNIKILNVAGPRASHDGAIYNLARIILQRLLLL